MFRRVAQRRRVAANLDLLGYQCQTEFMNVHLSTELKKLVDKQLASGSYSSAAEVIRAGLVLLEENERWRAEVRSKIAEGVAQAKAGQLVDGEEVFARLEAELDEAEEST